MVDDGRYKYVRLMDTAEELLFDMERDPHGNHNLIADPEVASVLHQMREEMLKIHIDHPAPKTGKATYTPGVPHSITRERLLKTRK
jgi:hypothetical protein